MMRFLAVGIPLLASANRVKVDPNTGHFVDADRNVRIFHGVNVIQKKFPWHPTTGDFDAESSMNAEDMQNLQTWGFNAVRLGVMWHGVEPAEGQFNQTYLNVVRKMVDDLHGHGIYTIVDFHQDAIAEQWCGEGIPSWVADKMQNILTDCSGWIPSIAKVVRQCLPFSDYNYAIDKDTGFPETGDRNKGCLSHDFTTYSQAPEVYSAWGDFYDQADIKDLFQKYWRKVAQTFKGAPGVLGYDLINEPNPGNFKDDALLFTPGHADKQKLQPLYTALSKIILSEDPEGVIMYEPAPFPATIPASIPGIEGVHPVGFTKGPADAAHQALSYHIYSCGFADPDCTRDGVSKTKSEGAKNPAATAKKCDKWASDAVNLRQKDAQKLGGGAFITEFGSCPDVELCYVEIDRVASKADTVFHSWAYWQFKYYQDITSISGAAESFYDPKSDGGKLQEKKVAALSRTFAPKIGGVPQLVKYDMNTGAFRLSYLSEGGSTEIFLNTEMNYQSGYEVQAINAKTTKSAANRIEVHADKGAMADVIVLRSTSGLAQGEVSGFFNSKDKDTLRWSIEDSATPGFELTIADNMTTGYWHGLKIRDDEGVEICSFGMQDDNHGPEGCNLEGAQQHGFLFSYTIELWKAKEFGIHTHVDDIGVDAFGPIYGKRLAFNWVDDNPPFANDSSIFSV